jgi:hypothetical protein
MEFLNNLSDSRLSGYCIYCGNGGRLTKEHSPSKVFLDEPFPENIPVSESCEDCNKSFSKDEEYMACVIECLKNKSCELNKLKRNKIIKILTRNKGLHNRIKEQFNSGSKPIAWEFHRVEKVICKLARGHLMYETSERRLNSPKSFNFWLFEDMPKEILESFNCVANVTNEVLPEIGSRYIQRIMVFPQFRLLFLDWVDVQEGQYRYICYPQGSDFIVRIVIGEFIGFEVIWSENEYTDFTEVSHA